jgi:hypothetical protein
MFGSLLHLAPQSNGRSGGDGSPAFLQPRFSPGNATRSGDAVAERFNNFLTLFAPHLITTSADVVTEWGCENAVSILSRAFERRQPAISGRGGGSFMNDLIFVVVVVVFFIISGLYVRFCEKL